MKSWTINSIDSWYCPPYGWLGVNYIQSFSESLVLKYGQASFIIKHLVFPKNIQNKATRKSVIIGVSFELIRLMSQEC